MIPLFVAIPLGAAFLMPILGKFFKRVPDILANLVSFTLLILSLTLIGQEISVYKVGGWEPIEGIPIGIYMVVDGLSIFMLIIISLISLLAIIYSVAFIERYTNKTGYYTLFLLMIAGMNGVVLSGDMFNLFVFLEVTAIASYALVAFGTEAEGLEGAFKYQVMGTVASGIILLGIALLYAFTGTLNMADMARIISEQGSNSLLLFVGVLFLAGFGLKAAIMPFHSWLPDAYTSAPAPISAMLAGVVGKSIGIYALCRIFFNVLGLGQMKSILYILMVLGIISMVAGAFLALVQKDFKRLLSYSSISQIGYIIFAFGLGTPLGFLGGLFHLLNHSIFKSLLFLNSGAIVYSTNFRNLKEMGGISKKMPVTGATSLVGSLSVVGIPPFNGFWSKLIIIFAAIQADYLVFALITIFASIITLAYYMLVQRQFFLGKLNETWQEIRETPPVMCISTVGLALICIIIGVLFIPGIKVALMEPTKIAVIGPAVEVLKNGVQYASLVLGK